MEVEHELFGMSVIYTAYGFHGTVAIKVVLQSKSFGFVVEELGYTEWRNNELVFPSLYDIWRVAPDTLPVIQARMVDNAIYRTSLIMRSQDEYHPTRTAAALAIWDTAKSLPEKEQGDKE